MKCFMILAIKEMTKSPPAWTGLNIDFCPTISDFHQWKARKSALTQTKPELFSCSAIQKLHHWYIPVMFWILSDFKCFQKVWLGRGWLGRVGGFPWTAGTDVCFDELRLVSYPLTFPLQFWSSNCFLNKSQGALIAQIVSFPQQIEYVLLAKDMLTSVLNSQGICSSWSHFFHTFICHFRPCPLSRGALQLSFDSVPCQLKK